MCKWSYKFNEIELELEELFLFFFDFVEDCDFYDLVKIRLLEL